MDCADDALRVDHDQCRKPVHAVLLWDVLPRLDRLVFQPHGVERTAHEADVACVLKQQADGLFKVSLRSRGATDVGAIAESNGGGGHRLAAGYTSQRDVPGTVEAIVAALRAMPGG